MWFLKFGLASKALIPRAQFRTVMHIFMAQLSFSNYMIRYTDQMTGTWSSTTTFIAVNISTANPRITRLIRSEKSSRNTKTRKVNN